MPTLGRPPPHIVIRCGREKLERCGYPTVKKFEPFRRRVTESRTSCDSVIRAMHTHRAVKTSSSVTEKPRDAPCHFKIFLSYFWKTRVIDSLRKCRHCHLHLQQWRPGAIKAVSLTICDYRTATHAHRHLAPFQRYYQLFSLIPVWYKKFRDFRPISRYISQMTQDSAVEANRKPYPSF